MTLSCTLVATVTVLREIPHSMYRFSVLSPGSGARWMPDCFGRQGALESREVSIWGRTMCDRETVELAADLHRDAEELRRKGTAVLRQDADVARKYLLASTVLDNSSVDVWLTLIELASTNEQKVAYRREAEKVLVRQCRGWSPIT